MTKRATLSLRRAALAAPAFLAAVSFALPASAQPPAAKTATIQFVHMPNPTVGTVTVTYFPKSFRSTGQVLSTIAGATLANQGNRTVTQIMASKEHLHSIPAGEKFRFRFEKAKSDSAACRNDLEFKPEPGLAYIAIFQTSTTWCVWRILKSSGPDALMDDPTVELVGK